MILDLLERLVLKGQQETLDRQALRDLQVLWEQQEPQALREPLE